jgi:hypothetical protein
MNANNFSKREIFKSVNVLLFTACASFATFQSAEANSTFGNEHFVQNNYDDEGHHGGSRLDLTYKTADCPPPVPLPAAAWLFGSALLGFVSLSNRRKV